MKREVRRQALGLRRINARLLVANHQHCGRRFALLVQQVKLHVAGGQTSEQQIDIVAVTDVLCALADIERNLRFALAGIATVKLKNSIFQVESAQLIPQWLFVEHLQVQPQFRRI